MVKHIFFLINKTCKIKGTVRKLHLPKRFEKIKIN